jgi:SAM-dependent methyltransferase
MSVADVNQEQSRYWNEQAGPKWAALQQQLDAQLEPFGVSVMEALGLRAGEHVLDVGCGAGATSIALSERVAPGEVVGLDISLPLLARARVRAEGLSRLRFEQADAQTFPFGGRPFDVVFSRFGVMFFGEPVVAFANLRSALCPGGRLGFVCWRDMSENPWVTLPLEAALPHLPVAPEPPVPGAPGPFAFADGGRTRAILEGAGYLDVSVARHDSELVLAGGGGIERATDMALQIGPLGRALASLDDDTRSRARGVVREALARHDGPRGVVLPAATWLVTARRGDG